MQSILSIQSHVAYGYVGNRAAVFPLQRLGFDVTAINTVQFSNHPGYGQFEGDVCTPDHLQRLISGLRAQGVLDQMNGLLTGYMGDPALGAILYELASSMKQARPDMIYCCDPVIGDIDCGVFVKPGVGEFFKSRLIEVADILTPNLFELHYLTDMPVNTLSDIKAACHALLARGPRMILVTSALLDDTPADHIEMIAHTHDLTYRVQTPRLAMNPLPNGAGDLAAALCLAYTLQHHPIDHMLSHLADSIYAVFEKTHAAGTRELQLIAAQDEIIHPHQHFTVTAV